MKYRFVYFSITIFWILVTALGTWYAFVEYSKQSYPQFTSCKALLKKYPNGFAAEWAPTVGPQTVLNANNKGLWEPLQVDWISTDLYNKQHMWFDVDGDGIMCEVDNPKSKKK